MTYDPATYWPARYEKQGDTYVAKGGRRDSHDRQLQAIAPYFDHLPSTGRVLDFGCGPQRFRQALEARGLDYEGVDLIPGLGTMDVDEIEPGSFDAATAIYVLQHIVDGREYDRTVALLHRCLVPGGTLLVVDHEPIPEPAPHMAPQGFGYVRYSQPWTDGRKVGSYDSHWIGVFAK